MCYVTEMIISNLGIYAQIFIFLWKLLATVSTVTLAKAVKLNLIIVSIIVHCCLVYKFYFLGQCHDCSQAVNIMPQLLNLQSLHSVHFIACYVPTLGLHTSLMTSLLAIVAYCVY